MAFGFHVFFQGLASAQPFLALVKQPVVRTPIAISLGAIAGALSRYYIGLWLSQQVNNSFPYGTLFVNLTGCLAMGFFVTLVFEKIVTIPPEIRLMVAVGFLGSYTTFSTFKLDTVQLLEDRGATSATLYWLGSSILGVINVQLGSLLAQWLK